MGEGVNATDLLLERPPVFTKLTDLSEKHANFGSQSLTELVEILRNIG